MSSIGSRRVRLTHVAADGTITDLSDWPAKHLERNAVIVSSAFTTDCGWELLPMEYGSGLAGGRWREDLMERFTTRTDLEVAHAALVERLSARGHAGLPLLPPPGAVLDESEP